ncbi:MAG TPA: CoB--CoM heterodisulfide reductase iron-sulfur subunit B family protein, partial [Nitrospiria bacterium]|nr:CoB--CoM heterodisulfide reductase iron-sulfur subunit B family protein [Nitrospiria bacterium]
MKFAFYPGCASQGACPELYQSTQLVVQKLGIELVELRAASCCGAGVIGEADPDLAFSINARTFSMAEEKGLDVLTICGTCQGVMGSANRQLKDDDALLARINGMLIKEGVRPYQGQIEVRHLLWIIVRNYGLEELKKLIKVRLNGLKVAPFYGCYILRPSQMLGFDDAENPTSLEELIRALGGEPVEYSGRTKCCGFPIILEKEEIATAMVGNHTYEAKQKGSDCMVTPCPLCHMNLDIYQERAEERIGADINLPILHLPQLIGLAMGFEPKALGLSHHLVSTGKLTDKIS